MLRGWVTGRLRFFRLAFLAVFSLSLFRIIFNWARQPTDAFREISAAAIIVLLLVILALNAVAILLRNRFERRW